ncbi:MBL fold metallo-hydrolase RNA specificity domain-containing protein [Sedimenticola selenatireducens]|uniref:MBL fold hydrolase n=1 Tax=Sedimenticola selenatireducens TaxID=191960 RepID=A0A2N6CVX1_9GAMM|nr:MBL fold metallo-hydrolase [Sedimenticola selenatireducens]PLX61332.1 MAG: MBL fold hydrolase [Sedimenticola selenatireducens]
MDISRDTETSVLDAGCAVHHHGAVNGVTGSCHELRLTDGRSLLVDCGLFKGTEVSAEGSPAENPEIEFPVDGLMGLVVTHVHIDHVGRIPYLLAAGFRGPIFCSEASALLLPLVLEDALKVGFTLDVSLIARFLEQIQRQVIALPYKRWQPVGDRMSIKLHPAGHILGSACVEVKVQVGDALKQGPQRDWRVVFSGDLGAPYTPLLPAPKSPWRADLLVLESTYGDRLHENRAQRQLRLRQVIEHALVNRGTVLVPAFSIGRTQELLYDLEGLIHRMGSRKAGSAVRWDDLEIIVDSPLAAKMTDSYRRLRHLWDKEALRRIRAGRHPLAFEQLYTVESHDEHLQAVAYLADSGRPAVVIAAGGMCSGGRVVNYLKAMLGDPRHDVLFVGYQAAGTAGRIIQRYGPTNGYVDLDGQRLNVRAKVHTIGGYSAHADQASLLRFVRGIRHQPQEIRLVHGDDDAKRALQAKLRKMLPESDVVIAG